MRGLALFLKSSIGRKVLMALTGLLLIGFLVVHLAGNLLILSGPETFNAYSHKLVATPLIYVAEVGLLVLFVAHFLTSFVLTRQNRAARPTPYYKQAAAGHTSRKDLASSNMIVSGIVVLAFVVLHVKTFKFGPYYVSARDAAVRDLYRLVVEVFQKPGYVLWYSVAMVLVGFHLWHGFGSAFESLGAEHRLWLRRLGQVIALVVAGGFLMIPVLVYFVIGGRP
jgi:succinate dehydrogenase / fumarate reductase cytochrome b subunit